MLPSDLLEVLQSVINTTSQDNFFEESLHKLQHFFPDSLLLSALDLIDRENVIKYATPWGATQFQVLGSTPGSSYSVFPSIPSSPALPSYCSCPAFAYSVLKSDSQLTCKHVLAVHLAQRLGRCVERSLSADDLASIIVSQYS